jgi:hypothetical protein
MLQLLPGSGLSLLQMLINLQNLQMTMLCPSPVAEYAVLSYLLSRNGTFDADLKVGPTLDSTVTVFSLFSMPSCWFQTQ